MLSERGRRVLDRGSRTVQLDTCAQNADVSERLRNISKRALRKIRLWIEAVGAQACSQSFAMIFRGGGFIVNAVNHRNCSSVERLNVTP